MIESLILAGILTSILGIILVTRKPKRRVRNANRSRKTTKRRKKRSKK